MNSSDVRAALRKHYSPAEYALCFEVADATGANKRRSADAVVMNLWPSRGLLIEGIEIKVSRNDWRNELANPAKAEAVAKYCDKWWIVTPENIVHAHELPPLWGHMVVLETGKVIVNKPAPQKESAVPKEGRGFMAAMLRRASGVDAGEVTAAVNMRVKELEKQIDQRVEFQVSQRTRQFNRGLEKLKMLEDAGVKFDQIYDAKGLAEQLLIGKTIKESKFSIGYHLTALESAIGALKKLDETLNASASVLSET